LIVSRAVSFERLQLAAATAFVSAVLELHFIKRQLSKRFGFRALVRNEGFDDMNNPANPAVER